MNPPYKKIGDRIFYRLNNDDGTFRAYKEWDEYDEVDFPPKKPPPPHPDVFKLSMFNVTEWERNFLKSLARVPEARLSEKQLAVLAKMVSKYEGFVYTNMAETAIFQLERRLKMGYKFTPRELAFIKKLRGYLKTNMPLGTYLLCAQIEKKYNAILL